MTGGAAAQVSQESLFSIVDFKYGNTCERTGFCKCCQIWLPRQPELTSDFLILFGTGKGTFFFSILILFHCALLAFLFN